MSSNRDLIGSLTNCIVACEHCFTACFEESNLDHLIKCIKLDRDCAEICALTLSFVARNSPEAASLVRTCAEICASCAEECEKHNHDHCRDCADACRECEEKCLTYLNQTESAGTAM
jgi:hypothetical protein